MYMFTCVLQVDNRKKKKKHLCNLFAEMLHCIMSDGCSVVAEICFIPSSNVLQPPAPLLNDSSNTFASELPRNLF
jgi:hypothetical protein